jgi:3-hydroxyisobutyrate dehydrogenase-like beta-hydroxyacid dehydrogenase
MEDVGLIGIGLVGRALAGRLLAAGFGVVGYDIDPAQMRELEAVGGATAASPSGVTARCRRIFLALMTSDIVRTVVEEEGGLMATSAPPTYIIDTSTGRPEESMALEARLAARGTAYLDATISGSSQQIREGAGVFMVGATPDGFSACSDLFSAVARDAVHVGPAGSGAKAKLATNLVLGLNRLALCEGMVFADRIGLDPAAFLELVRITPAYSAAVDVKGDKLLRRDYTPQSKLSQHLKDLRMVLEQAEKVGQDLPLARLHEEIIAALVQRGEGDKDSCVVIEELRRRVRVSRGEERTLCS